MQRALTLLWPREINHPSLWWPKRRLNNIQCGPKLLIKSIHKLILAKIEDRAANKDGNKKVNKSPTRTTWISPRNFFSLELLSTGLSWSKERNCNNLHFWFHAQLITSGSVNFTTKFHKSTTEFFACSRDHQNDLSDHFRFLSRCTDMIFSTDIFITCRRSRPESCSWDRESLSALDGGYFPTSDWARPFGDEKLFRLQAPPHNRGAALAPTWLNSTVMIVVVVATRAWWSWDSRVSAPSCSDSLSKTVV